MAGFSMSRVGRGATVGLLSCPAFESAFGESGFVPKLKVVFGFQSPIVIPEADHDGVEAVSGFLVKSGDVSSSFTLFSLLGSSILVGALSSLASSFEAFVSSLPAPKLGCPKAEKEGAAVTLVSPTEAKGLIFKKSVEIAGFVSSVALESPTGLLLVAKRENAAPGKFPAVGTVNGDDTDKEAEVEEEDVDREEEDEDEDWADWVDGEDKEDKKDEDAAREGEVEGDGLSAEGEASETDESLAVEDSSLSAFLVLSRAGVELDRKAAKPPVKGEAPKVGIANGDLLASLAEISTAGFGSVCSEPLPALPSVSGVVFCSGVLKIKDVRSAEENFFASSWFSLTEGADTFV